MNYDNLRTIIILIYLIFNILILNSIRMKKKKNKMKIELIISIICFFIFLVYIGTPIEQKWIKFDTIEQSFNYSYSQKQIVKIIEKDKYGIVIYNYDSKFRTFAFFKKDGDKWLITNPKNPKQKIQFNYPYSIVSDMSNDGKTKFVLVYYSNKYDEIQEVPITDSYSTKFEYEKIEGMSGYVTYYYYGIIENISGNYYLTIAGNTILIK